MFKKISLLVFVSTLPMLACGPSISGEELIILLGVFIVGLFVSVYGLIQLSKRRDLVSIIMLVIALVLAFVLSEGILGIFMLGLFMSLYGVLMSMYVLFLTIKHRYRNRNIIE